MIPPRTVTLGGAAQLGAGTYDEPALNCGDQSARTVGQSVRYHPQRALLSLSAVSRLTLLLPTLPAWPQRTYSRGVAPGARRLAGAAKILDWLLTHPGEGWQARWRAADADRGKEWVGALTEGDPRCEESRRSEILLGLNSLMISKIVLPRHGFLRRFKALTLLKDVQRMFPTGRLDRMREYGAELGMTPRHIDEGLRVISAIILHTGRDLEELTGEDIFHLRAVARRDRGEAYVGTHPAWDLLRGIGVIDSKDTLKDALRHGQRPTAELVDAYNLQSTLIRNMLVRYLEERRPGVDYGTFRGLVSELAGVFCADIEAHHPGIDTLRLPQDVVDGWKERLTTYTDKSSQVRERRSRIDVMMRIRGFYLDIQEWAHDDPFWAQWAVPSPITRGDGAGNHKIIAQVHSRMHQRVRERLHHLPVLVETAERVRRETAALLEAARATPFEEVFEHEGTRYLRILPKVNQIPSRLDHGSQHVYIKEVSSTGRRINQSIVEDDAFWAWAAIETLRHTGVRAEELTELTHLALVSYKLPDTSDRPAAPDRAVQEQRGTSPARQPRAGQRPGHHRQAPTRRERRQDPTGRPLRPPRARHRPTAPPPLPAPALLAGPGPERDQHQTPPRPHPRGHRPTRRCRRTLALHPARLPPHVRHRSRHRRPARPHRRPHPRAQDADHHPGIPRRLPGRPGADLPRLPGPAPGRPATGGVPRAHRAGVARLPAALRAAQGLPRYLRAALRNPVQARTRPVD